MTTLYNQLERMTTVVADTSDFNAIREFRPQDATTNPSLIGLAAKMPEYGGVVDEALQWAREKGGSSISDVVGLAIDRLAVEFGLRILEIVPGRVSTEVDARLSYDTEATIAKARQLIGQYEKSGASRDRILIKIASTWEGIRAAEKLEQEGIHCNLTLLFGLHQAIACAEAKVTLISPFVGRILDWYKRDTGRDSYPAEEDPGVVSVTRIYEYFKCHGHATEVMAASFRNLGEICELAGCDLMTISPKFLGDLSEIERPLPRKLDAEAAKAMSVPAIAMDEVTFRRMHKEDRMACEKTSEGIDGFSKALMAVEEQLADRLAELESGKQGAAGDGARP
jgi:transaldolase